MKQGVSEIYYVAHPEGGQYEAYSLDEVRRRMQLGLISEGQLMWNAKNGIWVPAQMMSVLKSTTVLTIPPGTYRSSPRTHSHVGGAGVSSFSTSSWSSKASCPELPVPFPQPNKQVIIYAYPPEKGLMVKLWNRIKKPMTFGAGVVALIATVVMFWNEYTCSRPLARGGGFKGWTIKAHHAYYLNPSHLKLEILPAKGNGAVPFQHVLTALAVRLPQNPVSGNYFSTVEIQCGEGKGMTLKGVEWKELSLLEGVDPSLRDKVVTRFLNSIASLESSGFLTRRL